MATKFYLPSSGAAAATPAWSTSWYNATGFSAEKLAAVTAKANSGLVTKTLTEADVTDRHFAVGMWVSDMLAAQTIANGTVITGSMQASEDNTKNNLSLHWIIRLVGSDGTTYGNTVVAFSDDATEANATLRSLAFTNTLSGGVSVTAGDRLVIELGIGGDPASGGGSHNSTMRIGETTAGADLAYTDADASTTAVPWINFSNSLVFLSCPTVTTQNCSNVQSTSATGNGTIGSTANGNATRRGFCYKSGTSGDPTTADSVAYDDGDWSAGAYTKGITGLSPGSDYRVRAYVTNLAGTNYGTTVQLTTSVALTVAGDSLLQSSTASFGLTQHNILAVNGATQLQPIDEDLVLVQHNVLSVANTGHLHTANNLTITAYEPSAELVLDNTQQLQTADLIGLIQHNILESAGVTQLHTANSPNLTQHHVLSVNNATHLQHTEILTYRAKVGSFNIDTSKTYGQYQVLTGFGFQPKVFMVWWSGGTNEGDTVASGTIRSGFGAATSSTNRFCLFGYSLDEGASSDTYCGFNNDRLISIYSSPSVVEGHLDFVSLDADGVTLVVDDQFSNTYKINYLALGGDDLTNVYISSKAMPLTLGNYSTTGVGFKPDALITAMPNVTLPNGNADAFYFNLGMATGSSNQGTVWGYSQDGATTANTLGYGYNGETIVYGNAARDSFVSFDNDGFTLNHLEGTTTAFVYWFIALKGGRYSVGDITTRTDGNDIQETVGFNPLALLISSANRTLSTQDTLTDHNRISVGATTSPNNRVVTAWSDEDALGDTETAYANYSSAVYAYVKDDAIVGLMDIKSIDQNGFTSVMDYTDPSACWVNYLAIGAKPFRVGLSVQDATHSHITKDPYTVALLHFNGTDGQTTITDESGKSWERQGTPELDTAIKKLGSASGLFPGGTGNYWRSSDSDDWNLGTGDFTLEAYVYLDALPSAGQGRKILVNSTDSSNYWIFHIYNSSGDYQLRLEQVGGPGGIVLGRSYSFGIEQFYHVAVTRESGISRLWVNGGKLGTDMSSGYTLGDFSGYMMVGGSSTANGWDGFIDEVRISKGKARYSTNFSPQDFEYSYIELQLKQHYILSVNNCSQLQTSDNCSLTQHNLLSVDTCTQLHTSDNLEVTYHAPGAEELEVQDSSQLHTAGELGLTQHNILSVDNAGQTHTSGEQGLVQHNILVVQDSAHIQTSNNVVLTQHNALTVSNPEHLQTSGNCVLTQHNVLVVSNAAHEHTVNNVNVGGIDILADYTIQLQTSDNVTLTQHNILSVNNSTHLQSSDNLTLGVGLIPSNSSQLHSSDGIGLTQHNILSVNNSSQLHTAENVTVVAHEPGAFVLEVQSPTHLQTSDGVGLTQHNILVVGNAGQLHSTSSIGLTQHHVLSVDNCTHLQTANNIEITAYNPQLTVQNSSHLHTSDNVSLVQHNSLVVNNTTHIQTSDNVEVVYHAPGAIQLVVQNSGHLHTSENIALVQHNILSVNNSVHNLTSSTIALGVSLEKLPLIFNLYYLSMVSLEVSKINKEFTFQLGINPVYTTDLIII